MGHREEMLDVIKRAYAARGDGDAADLVAAFHPEGQFNLVGDKSALHLTGNVQGHEPLQYGPALSSDTVQAGKSSARKSWTSSNFRMAKSLS